MKKYLILAAAAAMVMASCQKEETIQSAEEIASYEVTFKAFAKNATRSYVTDTQFWYVGTADLRETSGDVKKSVSGDASSNACTMQLSVYNEDAESDLFTDEKYTLNSSDAEWHANPAKFYPIGYDNFDFLAYSSTRAFANADWANAKKVTLEVTEDYTKDDILYAGGQNKASNHTATQMIFAHAQAWITVRLTASCDADYVSADATEIIAFSSIDWKDVYTSGQLVLEYKNDASADATWNFFTQEPKASYKMDDLYGNYNQKVRIEGKADKTSYFDMLLPAQPKQEFTISYKLGSETFEYVLNSANLTALGLDSGSWEMGKHYTYNINFQISEITVAPEVIAWVEETAMNLDL